MLYKLLILNAAGAQITPEGAKEILKAFYHALNALDTTASALLIFNGILVAAASFAADRTRDNKLLWAWVIVVILIALIAAGLCLRVAHISYPFYDKVVATSGRVDFTKEFEELNKEVALRTWLFQNAWRLSIIAVVMSFLAIAFRVVTDLIEDRKSRT
jgi:hypothetical protein